MSGPALATLQPPRPPGQFAMTWLIAWRAATEALRDRLSLLVGLFFALVLPLGVLVLVIRPMAAGADGESVVGDAIPFYLLLVGVLPAFSAVGIAAGQFAGEKERGILTPLLASPASNLAAVTCFAAVVASLISSRVRTFNAAQQLGGLALMPVWGVVFALAARLRELGPSALFGAVGALVVLDAALTALAAATWRREEVLAQR